MKIFNRFFYEKLFIFIILFFFIIASFSCVSFRFDNSYLNEAFENGNYEKCAYLASSKNYGEGNDSLKKFDIAVFQHYAKQYSKSAKNFGKIDERIASGDLRAVSQYESFYLNILNSLNYYHNGDFEGALAEIKKADDEKIRAGRVNKNAAWFILDESSNVELIRGYNKDETNDEAKNAFKTFGIKPAELNKGKPRIPTEADLFRGSPTAYYLGTLFRIGAGDVNGAELDADYLKVLNPKLNMNNDIYVPKEKARVNIIAFSGRIAQKEEKKHYYPPEINGLPVFLPPAAIPVGEDFFILPPVRFKFVYPAAGENKTRITRIEARIKKNEKDGNGTIAVPENKTQDFKTFSLTMLEDFGEHVKKDTALKARKEYELKAATAVLGKLAVTAAAAVTIIALRKQTEDNESFFADILRAALRTAELGLAAALEKIDSSIFADIRQAGFLPAHSFAGGITLEQGIYNIEVIYFSKNKNIEYIEHIEKFENVYIEKNKLNLLESICLN